MKHIIITRVNMPQNLDPKIHNRLNTVNPGESEEWTKKRVEMMDNGIRLQLENQTDKNFIHFEFWRKLDDVELLGNWQRDYHNVLVFVEPHECLPTNDVEREEVAFMDGYLGGHLPMRKAIKDYLEKDEFVIITNVDSDDSIPVNFVEEIKYSCFIHSHVEKPFFVDVQGNFRYHLESGKVGYHSTKSCSMFGSVVESSNDFKLLYYLHGHSRLHNHMKGFKITNLFGCMLIHDDNIFTQSLSDRTKTEGFDITNYFKGIK